MNCDGPIPQSDSHPTLNESLEVTAAKPALHKRNEQQHFSVSADQSNIVNPLITASFESCIVRDSENNQECAAEMIQTRCSFWNEEEIPVFTQ